MRSLLIVCLLAAAMVLSTGSSAARAVVGTWDGNLEGVKAVTLCVHDTSGTVAGDAVFYRIKDEGAGFHTGQASPPLPLQKVRWNGKVLRFWITGSDGKPLRCEMWATGPRTAKLRRLAGHPGPELTITLWRQ